MGVCSCFAKVVVGEYEQRTVYKRRYDVSGDGPECALGVIYRVNCKYISFALYVWVTIFNIIHCCQGITFSTENPFQITLIFPPLLSCYMFCVAQLRGDLKRLLWWIFVNRFPFIAKSWSAM